MSLERELALRLADIAAMLATAADRINHEEWEPGDCGTLITACDFALRGESGCWEPEEFADMREKALLEHAERLGYSHRAAYEHSEEYVKELRELLIEALVKLHRHVVHAGLNFEYAALRVLTGGEGPPTVTGWRNLWSDLQEKEGAIVYARQS